MKMFKNLALCALLALPCGVVVAADNGPSNNNPATTRKNAEARACFDKTEEQRLACASRAMNDEQKSACYRVQDEEVRARQCKAPLER